MVWALGETEPGVVRPCGAGRGPSHRSPGSKTSTVSVCPCPRRATASSGSACWSGGGGSAIGRVKMTRRRRLRGRREQRRRPSEEASEREGPRLSTKKTAEEEEGQSGGAMLDHLLGLLKVRIVRGVNLAIRDLCSSDPYVVVRMDKQRLKTSVIRRSTNPEWNQELTLSIEDPAVPIRLEIFDKGTFRDDSMGYAELDIRPLVEIVKMKLQDVADNTVVKKLMPNRQDCLAEESKIFISEGKVKQDLVFRLKNVECGELEVQLQWVDIPGSRGV